MITLKDAKPTPCEDPVKTAPILQWPDPRVMTWCREVEPSELNDAARLAGILLEALLDTSSHRPGLGLSANQIGATLRVFVVDTLKVPGLDTALINPEMWAVPEGGTEEQTEACLSLPSRCLPTVLRYKTVRVQWTEPIKGERRETVVSGLAARVVQHEMDHLDGLLITQFLSRQERRFLEREVGKRK